jgi:hypothetical protein
VIQVFTIHNLLAISGRGGDIDVGQVGCRDDITGGNADGGDVIRAYLMFAFVALSSV